MSQDIYETISHQDFELTVNMPAPQPPGVPDVSPRKPAPARLQGKPSQWAVDLAYLARHLGRWVLVCMVCGYGGYHGLAWSGDHVVQPLVKSGVDKDAALTRALDRNERLTELVSAQQKLLLTMNGSIQTLNAEMKTLKQQIEK